MLVYVLLIDILLDINTTYCSTINACRRPCREPNFLSSGAVQCIYCKLSAIVGYMYITIVSYIDTKHHLSIYLLISTFCHTNRFRIWYLRHIIFSTPITELRISSLGRFSLEVMPHLPGLWRMLLW